MGTLQPKSNLLFAPTPAREQGLVPLLPPIRHREVEVSAPPKQPSTAVEVSAAAAAAATTAVAAAMTALKELPKTAKPAQRLAAKRALKKAKVLEVKAKKK